MPAVRIVTQEDGPPAPVTTPQTSLERVWAYVGVTMVLVAAIVPGWSGSRHCFSRTFRKNVFERPVDGSRRMRPSDASIR